MSKLSRQTGATSQILQVFIRDSSSTTGAGLTGLAHNTAGLTAYYHRDTDTTATAISLVTMTVGTFTSSGFKEIDSSNMPGWYQLCPPNACFASGASSVGIHLNGATNMAPLPIEIDLDARINPTWGTVTITGGMSITNSSGTALNIQASGAGDAGVYIQGGITNGVGMRIIGGDTSGDALAIEAGDGHGITITANAAGKDGISISADRYEINSTIINGTVNGNATSTAATTIETKIDTIKAKTDNLPSDPADASDIAASFATVNSTLSTITGYIDTEVAAVLAAVDTEVAAIKEKTDNLPVNPAAVGSQMTLDLTQTISDSQTDGTVGAALLGMESQSVGKWTIVGTTLTLYRRDGATVVRTFTLDSASNPTSRT